MMVNTETHNWSKLQRVRVNGALSLKWDIHITHTPARLEAMKKRDKIGRIRGHGETASSEGTAALKNSGQLCPLFWIKPVDSLVWKGNGSQAVPPQLRS